MSKLIWQVRDYADGWIDHETMENALLESRSMSGALIRQATRIEFDWRAKTGRYAHGWSLWIADGIMVGDLSQPVQSKGYTGPRWRGEVLLPGIRIRKDLLHETELDAAATVEHAVVTWFAKVGVPVADRGSHAPVLQR